MSTRLFPAEAVPRIDHLWSSLTISWLDLAVQQHSGLLAEDPGFPWLQAWRRGQRPFSVQLMLGQDYLSSIQNFITTCHEMQNGVGLTRIHLVDEVQYTQDENCRDYLDWLREHFCQINIPWGGEQVHWLPVSECDRAGIPVPSFDMALFDGRSLLGSDYDESGKLVSRTVYSDEEDPGVLYEAR